LSVTFRLGLRMFEDEVTCECRPTSEEVKARKDRISARRTRIDAKIALE
jgi:hypothetical protein